MHGALVVVLLVGLGCGRIGFDAPSPGEAGVIAGPPDGRDPIDTPGDPPIDPPPIPSAAICHVTQLPVGLTPARADLAITDTDEGYAVLWLDTAMQVPSIGFRLAPDHLPISGFAVAALRDAALGGLRDVGDVMMIASSTGDARHVLAVDPVSFATRIAVEESPTITGRDPFVSDTARTTHVLVSVNGGDVLLDPLAASGTAGTRVGTGMPIRRTKYELACAPARDHAVCVWTQDNDNAGSPTQCIAAEIRLPPDLRVGTSGPNDPADPLSVDCRNPRITVGPDPANTEMIVWETSKGSVEAEFLLDAPGTIHRQIAAAGSAPKVVFDGAQFRIAWLDPAGTLQLTSFGLDGKLTTTPLPGWQPSGPEAFELSRRAGVTSLALVRPGELDVLRLCP